MSIYELRPHHLLCISFFEGKGYSPEFVHNMTKLIEALDASSQIRLKIGADQICSSCPNNKETGCDSGSKVNRYDKAVLAFCGLKAGQFFPFDKLMKLADAKIIRAGKLSSVCGDCQWSVICQKKADIRQVQDCNERTAMKGLQ